jgi:hypothetical protein
MRLPCQASVCNVVITHNTSAALELSRSGQSPTSAIRGTPDLAVFTGW